MNTPLKSNRGRPPSTVKKDDLHVSIDASVALYWRVRLFDNFTKATKVGAMSELVERLLRQEMERDRASANPTNEEPK